PNKDLHSGGYGGAVANPINALVTMLATLKDEKGRVTVPGFYDRVQPIGPAELESWRKLPFSEQDFARSVGVDALPGEEGYSVLERLWARPTLDINGIWGGYQGEGSKTVLPARAGAKVSMRLVPDQDDHEIFDLVKAHLLKVAPQGVKVEVTNLHGGLPVALDPAAGPVQAARAAFERAYPGREVALIRSGGSIPVVATFKTELGAPVLLVDLGLPDDGAHGPNERYSVDCFHRGVDIAGYLYEEIARL
ncbi:MAG TPA: M20/M25/M40 family metallo-hydrolase, partial [Deinococcales bacterium]|nr:M20/M25/M40 family metallo-hydrolase [Deinococcales bacterium]